MNIEDAQREKRRAAARAWRQRNPTDNATRSAAWRAASPDYRERAAKFRAENRERLNAEKVARRAELRDTPEYRGAKLAWSARERANARGLDYDLTSEWVIERVRRGTCEVTGLTFDLAGKPAKGQMCMPRTPSLDRRDNAKGYTQDNVQVVVAVYNLARSTFQHEDVLQMAEALCSRR